jgi:sigma-B regulation protein RsbU (phosphoserine phosphatase)
MVEAEAFPAKTLFEDVLVSDRGRRRDLQGAKDVQQAFFPPESLAIPNLSCATLYRPAHEIGGDYYDFLSLQDGRWGIAIGDVCGKGIGAALIMASLHASLRAQALRSHLNLSALIGDVNRLVFASSPTHLFASLFYAEYDPAALTLNYVNAGHNPPIVIRTGNRFPQILHLKAAGGIPVGIAPDSRFESRMFQLEANDVVVAYTDGITEAQNGDGDFWGQQKLEELLLSSRHKAPQQIIEDTLNKLTEFVNGHPQRDDMTLMVMRVQRSDARL